MPSYYGIISIGILSIKKLLILREWNLKRKLHIKRAFMYALEYSRGSEDALGPKK
jgi:hypothetical protein